MPRSAPCLHTCVCLSACPSLCWACWQGYFHYTVTVHQSPAPRQPCRLATRVRFTKGRLQPGSKGEKTEGKKKGQDVSAPPLAFPPFGFLLRDSTVLHNPRRHSLEIWQLLSEPTVGSTLKTVWNRHKLQGRQVMSRCHFGCALLLDITPTTSKSGSTGLK